MVLKKKLSNGKFLLLSQWHLCNLSRSHNHSRNLSHSHKWHLHHNRRPQWHHNKQLIRRKFNVVKKPCVP
jgi:hypothetical protein